MLACMYAKQLDILVGVAVLSDHDRYRVAIAKYSLTGCYIITCDHDI